MIPSTPERDQARAIIAQHLAARSTKDGHDDYQRFDEALAQALIGNTAASATLRRVFESHFAMTNSCEALPLALRILV